MLFVLSTVSGSVLTTNRSCLPVCSVYYLWFCTQHQQILSSCLSSCLFCLLPLVLYSPPTDPVFLFFLSTVSGSVLTTNRSCLPVCSVYCLWFCTQHQQILSSCLSSCLFCLLPLVLYSPPTDHVFLFVFLFILSTVSGSVLTTNRSWLPVCSVYCPWFCTHHQQILSFCLFCLLSLVLHSPPTDPVFLFVLLFVVSTAFGSVFNTNRFCRFVRSAVCSVSVSPGAVFLMFCRIFCLRSLVALYSLLKVPGTSRLF